MDPQNYVAQNQAQTYDPKRPVHSYESLLNSLLKGLVVDAQFHKPHLHSSSQFPRQNPS